MSTRRAAAVIAAVVLGIGLVLALLPLSIGTGSDAIRCGSAAAPYYTTADIEDIVDPLPFASRVAACEDEVSYRRLVAFPLAGVGALALLFLWLTGQHKTRWDSADEAVDERPEPRAS